MFWRKRTDLLFENQFTEVEDGYHYRRWSTGAAYKISTAQYEQFSDEFCINRRWNSVLMYGGIATYIGAIVTWSVAADVAAEGSDFNLVLWVTMPLVFLILVGHYLRAYTAPARSLARDLPIAPPLNRQERKLRSLTSLSYGQLALVPLAPLFLLGSESWTIDVWRGWGRLWWVLLGGFTGLACVQAYRKWSLERDRSREPPN